MIYCLLVAILFLNYSLGNLCQPYGVRLQLGKYYTTDNDMNDMINILYNTNASCPETYVTLNGRQYPVTQTQIINMTDIYQDFQPPNKHFYKVNYTYVTYVHRVQIGKINAGETYEYILYSDKKERDPLHGSYKFNLPLKKIKSQTRAVFFGDLDSQWVQNISKPTFDWFQKQSQTNRTEYDVMIFTGDMAYDLESENCQRGDYFLRNFSTIAAYWPTMLTPGNHDTGNNTKHSIYRKSFYSPELYNINTDDNFFNLYSFDIGLVHFIAFNPYKFIYQANSSDIEIHKKIYYDALRSDLIQAQENQERIPWIVVYSHFPMMCADAKTSQCTNNVHTLKMFYNLFQEFGVQLYVAAHQHSYERAINPEHESDRDTQHMIYYDRSPVYLVEGASGNDQDWNETIQPKQRYTQSQYYQQSVGIMTVLNKTHLYFEQTSTEDGRIVDYFYIVQSHQLLEKYKSQVWVFIFYGLIGVSIIVAIAFILKKFTKEKDQKNKIPLEYEMQSEDNFKV